MKIILALAFWLVTSLANAQSITWTNDRGGTGSGDLIGSDWTIGLPGPTASIPLKSGVNPITVTYTDASSNQTTASLAVTYAPTFPGNTLAGAWAFQEPSGLTVVDSSGNANNGTLINGAVRTSNTGGHGDQGVSLDGISQYVAVPVSNNSLQVTQSFTMSAWVFPTGQVKTDERTVMAKGFIAGAYTQMTLYASSGFFDCGAGTPAVLFATNGSFGPFYSACYSQPLTLNRWTHLAATYDNAAGELKLYIDGVLRATTPATGYMEPSNVELRIGSDVVGTFFEGVIDETRVYNWALPQAGVLNATFGVACSQAMFNENNSVGGPSIIGNANCPIISQTVPPGTVKIPASADALKLGAASSGFKVGQVGQ